MAEPGNEPIKIETKELGEGVWEVSIKGSLDHSNFTEVESAIDAIFKRGQYKIVINLKATKYISSAGFGCFISSLDTATKNKGDIVFAATPPEVQDVFNILGLSKILKFAEDEKAALAHFSDSAS